MKIGYVVLILAVIISALGAAIIYVFTSDRKMKDEEYEEFKKQQALSAEGGRIKSTYFRNLYYRTQDYLTSRGVDVMAKGKISPYSYFAIRIITVVLCPLVVNAIGLHGALNVLAMIAAAVVGFIFPELLIKLSDDSDNTNMMDDISSIYENLILQVESGVFISEALCDCKNVVTNKRLKQALVEFERSVHTSGDVAVALMEFERKFNNQYVAALVVAVKQTLSTGQSVEILEDLVKQIEDVETALQIKEKEKADVKANIATVIIFVALIVTVLFLVFSDMNSSMGKI